MESTAHNTTRRDLLKTAGCHKTRVFHTPKHGVCRGPLKLLLVTSCKAVQAAAAAADLKTAVDQNACERA